MKADEEPEDISVVGFGDDMPDFLKVVPRVPSAAD
jgi:hypothetical protein